MLALRWVQIQLALHSIQQLAALPEWAKTRLRCWLRHGGMLESDGEAARHHACGEDDQRSKNDFPNVHQESLMELSGPQTVDSKSAAKFAEAPDVFSRVTVQTLVKSMIPTHIAAACQRGRDQSAQASRTGFEVSAAMTRFSNA